MWRKNAWQSKQMFYACFERIIFCLKKVSAFKQFHVRWIYWWHWQLAIQFAPFALAILVLSLPKQSNPSFFLSVCCARFCVPRWFSFIISLSGTLVLFRCLKKAFTAFSVQAQWNGRCTRTRFSCPTQLAEYVAREIGFLIWFSVHVRWALDMTKTVGKTVHLWPTLNGANEIVSQCFTREWQNFWLFATFHLILSIGRHSFRTPWPLSHCNATTIGPIEVQHRWVIEFIEWRTSQLMYVFGMLLLCRSSQ